MNALELWGIGAAIFVWLALSAQLRLLALPDEGRYVSVAWEMLRSGDWLTPTLNGLPFFHKPPLFYWITAAALKVFGLHEGAARAAPLIGATLGAFAFYVFLRCWCGLRMARWALAVLMVQPLFFIGAQFANLDMLVAGCISATILLLAHAALCIERELPWRRALLGAYALAALGVLAKGLIGFVLPALVVTAWLLAGWRWRTLLRLVSLPGIALFLGMAAPWFVAMQQRFPDFLHYFFVVQHFQRFSAGGFNNVQPFWFYPAVLAVLSLPWLPWLVFLVRRKPWRGDSAGGGIRLLMAAWLLVVVGFFSLPQSKLVGYVLPAVPPLAFFIAQSYVSWLASQRVSRWWRASMALTVLLGLGTVIGLAVHPLKTSKRFAQVLSSQRGADQPVFMLKQYAYDLPFYAQLTAPVTVVDDWSAPEVQASDNWRKEIADARQFAPAAGAMLIEPAGLTAALCQSPVSWLLGEAASVRVALPQMAATPALAMVRSDGLWRVESKALDCPGRPNAGSAGK